VIMPLLLKQGNSVIGSQGLLNYISFVSLGSHLAYMPAQGVSSGHLSIAEPTLMSNMGTCPSLLICWKRGLLAQNTFKIQGI
jgi:hypothetical protein